MRRWQDRRAAARQFVLRREGRGNRHAGLRAMVVGPDTPRVSKGRGRKVKRPVQGGGRQAGPDVPPVS